MKEFYQNSTESLSKLTKMSRKILSLLTIVVVLLCATAVGGENTKEKKQCKTNEYWSACRGSCESTCGFPNGPLCLKKTPGCICQKGFVRGSKGDCIDPSECGNERTGPVQFGNGNSNTRNKN